MYDIEITNHIYENRLDHSKNEIIFAPPLKITKTI